MKYLKLFITVFAAVYLAIVCSVLTQDYLLTQAYPSEEYAFTESDYPEPIELASVTVTPVQASAIEETRTITVQPMSAERKTEIKQSMRKDWEACKYWSRAHIIRATEKSKYYMEQSCNRYNQRLSSGF